MERVKKINVMAIKFQYNKTSLGEMEKQLKVRTKALPTIKSKEAALRLEVKKARKKEEALAASIAESLNSYAYMNALWGEFTPSLLEVKDVVLGFSKIAGVKLPHIKDIEFAVSEYNLFSSPMWYGDGIELLKKLAEEGLRHALMEYVTDILENARKKTTQKVNLYEKVQIPGYKEAILKIKRFMEDQDNLSKAAQKIVKSRHEAQAREEEAV